MSEWDDRKGDAAVATREADARRAGGERGVKSALGGDDDGGGRADAFGRPETTRVVDAKGASHEVGERAWSTPGRFDVTRDDQGRTMRIEGWLSPTDEKRSSADAAMQRDVAKSGDLDHAHGGHLIAHSLGGPGVGEHGDELARANLTPMTDRANTSYVGNHEQAVRDHVRAHPDKQFYMQADVRYVGGDRGGDGADGVAAAYVTHRLFERDPASGQVLKVDGLSECETKVTARPAVTRAAAVSQASGQPGVAFSRPGRAGTHEHDA